MSGPLINFDYEYRPSARDLRSKRSGQMLLSKCFNEDERYALHLDKITELSPYFSRIPVTGTYDSIDPFWNNDWFEGLDGMSLYYFLARNNPKTYLEVGSGNSTKFARRAVRDHNLRTRIISIDPEPRVNIDMLCDEVIRARCEDVPPSIFEQMTIDDVLFVDNSHRSFQGSDVTVFFTEILPVLPSGMLFGLHDIFLPDDYPERWLERYYNEQYLLMAFLVGGMGGGRIELPNAYMVTSGRASQHLGAMLSQPEFDTFRLVGGCFWMRR